MSASELIFTLVRMLLIFIIPALLGYLGKTLLFKGKKSNLNYYKRQ
ncbi:hypothetical protein [uncultured Arcticibacterium sp.]